MSRERLVPIVSITTVENVFSNASQDPESFISSVMAETASVDPHSNLLEHTPPSEWYKPRNLVRWMGRQEWWFFELLGRSLVWSAIYQESRIQGLSFPSSTEYPEPTNEDIIEAGGTQLNSLMETVTKVREEWEEDPLAKMREGLLREELVETPEPIARGLPVALMKSDGFEVPGYWLQMTADLKSSILGWKRRYDERLDYALRYASPQELYTDEELRGLGETIQELSSSPKPKAETRQITEDTEETTEDRLFDRDLSRQLALIDRIRILNGFGEIRSTNASLANLICLGWEAAQEAFEASDFSDSKFSGKEDAQELELRFLGGAIRQWQEFTLTHN